MMQSVMSRRLTAVAAAREIPLWAVWAAALAFAFAGLGSFGIRDNNEGLYAEIAREMLHSTELRAWVIPHLNGLPYMEKPPLLYWLTALSFALFGELEWAARLMPALSSLACAALLVWFGKAVHRPQAGRLAALMFVSGTGVVAMSHVLMFDMLLSALLTAALMCGYRYLHEKRLAFLRGAYAFLALAVLAKGVVALILFGLVVLAYVPTTVRSAGEWRRACARWFEPKALLVFLAMAAPWHIAASFAEPTFAWFYFINEHLLRFLGMREPHDYYTGGWWYYLPRMAIYLFPWSFLAAGIAASWRPGRPATDKALTRFAFFAWMGPLLFFSLSCAKANYYMVAAMPFAAFHLAAALEDRNFLGSRAALLPAGLITACALLACLALSLRMAQSDLSVHILGLPLRIFLPYFFGGLAILSVAAALGSRGTDLRGVLAYLVLSIWTAVGLAGTMRAMDPLLSERRLAQAVTSEFPARLVYLYRNFEEVSSLPFYLKRPLPVVEPASNDLAWGGQLHANHILLSQEQFVTELKRHPVALIVPQGRLRQFRATGLDSLLKGEKRVGDTLVFFN